MGVGFNGTMLAIFTALAPAGAVAFSLAGVVLLLGSFKKERVPMDGYARLNHALALPLLVSWIGFISAATHLGMPSNALFVVDGIGRSPLSNEVAATVGFLFFSGVYWLYTFKLEPRALVANALLVPAIAFGMALVVLSAGAYAIDTVLTWDSWHAAANLVLSAVMGGSAVATALLGGIGTVGPKRLPAVYLGLGIVALAAGTAVACAQWEWLEGISNYSAAAQTLVAGYPAAIAVRTALAAVGFGLLGIGLLASGKRQSTRNPLMLVGCACLLVGILVLRLPFYEMHLTVGF